MNGELVVPDGIEPVEAWRCWVLSGEKLLSLNGEEWTPGLPLQASCRGHGRWTPGLPLQASCRGHGRGLAPLTPRPRVWRAVRGEGETPAEIEANWERKGYGYFTSVRPTVELPEGYGYMLCELEHGDSPAESCACGIYAAKSRDQIERMPGNVLGKVKLWGKVIPAEIGYRAEYAYPSLFIAPPELEENPVLAKFGVPISVDTSRQEKTVYVSLNTGVATTTGANLPCSPFVIHPAVRRERRVLIGAAGLNLGFALYNILVATHVI